MGANPGGKAPMAPGGQPGGKPSSAGGRGGSSVPAPPADDVATKEVWGHLPERLRRQMTQYYREQFSGPYGELLREYYSALAAREKGAKK